MSQVDKLLETLSGDEGVTYAAGSVTERHIVVNADRFITVPEELKRIGVETDHNVETVTFDCPRYWDDHDLSTMVIYINYMSANGVPGSYPATNRRIDADDSTVIHFDWIITNNVTQTAGKIAFAVCAKSTDDDGILEHYWHSEVNTDMYVSEGLEVVNTILEQNPDILTHVLQLADKFDVGGGGSGDENEGGDSGDDPSVGLSGGTMTGPIVMPKGDSNTGIENGENEKIFGYGVDDKFHVGDAEYPLELHGIEQKPRYNGQQLAFASDVEELDRQLKSTAEALNEKLDSNVEDLTSDIEALESKVGDVMETFRTDLGDDWLLCNGASIPEGEYPELRELLPYNTAWVEAVPENEYVHISPIPNTHKWVRVKRKVDSSTYAWDKAEVYDAETRTSLTVKCPLVVSGKTCMLVGITYDDTRYVLAALCYGEKTAGRYTMHLYASDDLVEWGQIYTYTFTEAIYPSDFAFDGVAYALLEGYVPSEGSTSSNYVRNAWLTPTGLSGTTKSSGYVGGGYKDARFRPCPPGYFSLAGDTQINRAGTGALVMYFAGSSYAPDGLVFFGDRYLLTVAEGSYTFGTKFYVVDLSTKTDTEIDMGVLCGYKSDDSNIRSYGCEYDKNTNEWVFLYGYIMSPVVYHAVYISGDADPTDTTQYRVVKLKAAPETKYYLGQKSLNGASWCENAVRDPSLKCLPEQDGIKYMYVYAGKEHVGKPVELEYIESTGIQYIDTGIIGKSGLEIEIDFEFTEIGTGSQIPVGSMAGSSNRIYPLSSGNYVGYGEYFKLSMTAAANERYDIYCKLYAGEQTVTVNGTTIYTGHDTATYDSGCNVLLFAASNDGVASYHAKTRTRSCKIRENGVLVRDYVPCRLATGTVCMYDRVSGEYAMNRGAGKFIAGAEVGVLEEV